MEPRLCSGTGLRSCGVEVTDPFQSFCQSFCQSCIDSINSGTKAATERLAEAATGHPNFKPTTDHEWKLHKKARRELLKDLPKETTRITAHERKDL